MRDATPQAQPEVRFVPRERIRPRPITRDRAATARVVILLLVMTLVTGWYFTNATAEPSRIGPAGEQEGLRVLIYLTVLGIEAHREATGALPSDLAPLGLDDPDLVYEVEAGRYVLVGSAPDSETRVIYRSGDDTTPFELAFQRVRRGRP